MRMTEHSDFLLTRFFGFLQQRLQLPYRAWYGYCLTQRSSPGHNMLTSVSDFANSLKWHILDVYG
jgi:hypothetical protein